MSVIKKTLSGGVAASDLAILAFAAASGWFLAKYLNFDAELLVWLASAACVFFAVRFLRKEPLRGKLANFFVGLFAAFFTFSLVLGEHIVVGDAYSGLSDANYISSYSAIDVCAFVCILPGVFALFSVPVSYIRAHGSVCKNRRNEKPVEMTPMGVRWVLLLTVLVFVLWVPYLVVYWPGFIFSDSLSSLGQALGGTVWTNHHPVAYTAFLAACLKIVAFFGFGHTAGIGLSTAVQMAFMAFGFGYLSRWIVVRGSLKPIFGIAIAVAFGLCSYIGSFSIALWKDPMFSTAGLLISTCLADLAWSRGKAAIQGKWLVLFCFSALLMMFLRNNGVFVMALIGAFVFVAGLVDRFKHYGGSSGYFDALGSSIVAIVLYVAVSGPGFTALGVVPSEASEAAGVPLNQMARVAALGGEMTESDKEYLGSIIPFEEYSNRYYPCCTDCLKWSAGFSNEALQNGMWTHWASMLVRNPRVYFEAWALQTFGFWAINTEQQAGWTWNVSGGVPRNVTEAGVQELSDGWAVSSSSLSTNERATSMFPVDSWSVPISWLLWISCYLALLLCLIRKPLWALGLIPSIGVAATLLVASPIWYWPRYGAVLQFCIPYYALLVYLLIRDSASQSSRLLSPS